MDAHVLEQELCDLDQGMVFQHQPEEVHLLQGEDGVALRLPAQGDVHNAEKDLRIQHIAELEGKAVKIVLLQHGIIPQRGPLGPVGDEEGVAEHRASQLRRGDKDRAEGKKPEHQGVFHAEKADRLPVAEEEIARRQEDRLHDDVEKDIVPGKLDMLAGGVRRTQDAGLHERPACEVQGKREDQQQDTGRRSVFSAPLEIRSNFSLFMRPVSPVLYL